jgi:nucleotide-binding universal stress UspA family protein
METKIPTILLTTDLSASSLLAFDAAVRYAKAFGTSVTILSIIEDPSKAALAFAMDFPVLPDLEVVEQLKTQLTADLIKLGEQLPSDIKCHVKVIESALPIHEEIAAQAKELNAELIVIASGGAPGLLGLFLGSVAERLIDSHPPCPILVVPVVD